MKLEDFITYVSTKGGNTRYIPPINEEQFEQIVLLIKKSKTIKKKMNSSDKASFGLVGNFLILEECCKAFQVKRLDMWFIIKELQILLK